MLNDSEPIFPKDPGRLIQQLKEDKDSNESDRMAKNILIALLASRGGHNHSHNHFHTYDDDTDRSRDYGQALSTFNQGTSKSVSQTEADAKNIGFFDQYLLRNTTIPSQTVHEGILVFDFKKANRYTFVSNLGGSTKKFNIELKEY